MTLFQNSVLKKHLKTLDDQLLKQKYETYKTYFLNPTIQDNIRASKEEQYQATFLNELFVKILGYTLHPNPDYNLTTEYKNVKDAKKADGAILNSGKAVAVIELKGTNTTDLDKIESQAFGYKNNQPDAVYVITSNFEKLRFYIDNAVDSEDFNLFHLSYERFKILWLCLAKDHIFKNLPKQIKDSSLLQEENITKQLYKDYSAFKHDIFNSLVKLNPEIDKVLLFKKTQKLLDRFLFIFFAEDGGLLPPNAIKAIIDQWVQLRDELDAYTPLYSRFKKYFGYMNTGHKGKKHDIFAYNGGLFAPDELLDNIKIDDTLLYTHTQNLSNYDFKSEVDVNILGHIFEHSLNEIEEMTAQLEGKTIDKGKTKRKKDGVFYTPKYITKYIVENTVGKLCEEKKAALAIDEAEYNKDRKRRKKATLKKLLQQLEDYREWLLSLTICDPACGSGAFLNQALEFLINEHRYIDELQTKLLGGGFVFPNVANAILENNLYGVDINEESVEIAKLSLWLRSAQPNRKLTSLNNNIKCGNSLIDDPTVAGDKAFNWYSAFPKVFRPKEKEAYHIVLTTHNSRTSQRMKQMNIQKGEPVELNLEEEIQLTKIIRAIIEEYNYQCLAYNVCKDHLHLILVCEYQNLHDMVRNLKSNSSRRFNIWKGITISSKVEAMGQAPLDESADTSLPPTGLAPLSTSPKRGKTQNKLWSQKFFFANLDVWELATLSKRPGYAYDDPYLGNAYEYIKNNRIKHGLPASDELQTIIASFLTTSEIAFELEYDGGFDVVIGNPPYLRVQGLRENFDVESQFYEKNYKSATGRFDIYVLFIEKTFSMIKDSGLVSMILPHKFMVSDFGEGIRRFLVKNKAVDNILHFESEMVFKEASTYTCILGLSKKEKENIDFIKINPNSIFNPFDFEQSSYSSLSKEKWNLQSNRVNKLFEKLYAQPYRVKEVFKYISQGVVSTGDKIFLVKGTIQGSIFKGYSDILEKEIEIEADLVKPLLKGENVKKYSPLVNDYYIIYPHFEYHNKTLPVDEKFFKEKYPKAYNYLLPYKQELIDKKIRYKTNPTHWYSLHRSREMSLFEQEKIITPEISLGTNMTLDKNYMYHNTKCYSLVKKKEYLVDIKVLLAILNSKLLWFFLKSTGYVLRGGFFTFKTKYLEPFPLPNLPTDEKPYIEKVDTLLKLNADFQQKSSRFHRRLQSNLTPMGHDPLNTEKWKLSKKLQAFYDHDFKTFVKELKKKKIKLSLTQQDEWEEYFDAYKSEINQLQAEINKTDKEINQMVYELYGLTDEEIRIVEES